MILPFPVGGGEGKKKGGGSGKRGKKGGKGQGDVQVNLTVAPHAFNFDLDHDNEYTIGESEDDDGGMPGRLFPSLATCKGRGRHQRRRGILAGLAMEESWHYNTGATHTTSPQPPRVFHVSISGLACFRVKDLHASKVSSRTK